MRGLINVYRKVDLKFKAFGFAKTGNIYASKPYYFGIINIKDIFVFHFAAVTA